MLQPKREELGIEPPLERFEKAERDILRRKLDLRHHAHHLSRSPPFRGVASHRPNRTRGPTGPRFHESNLLAASIPDELYGIHHRGRSLSANRRRQPVPCRCLGDCDAMRNRKTLGHDDQTASGLEREIANGLVNPGVVVNRRWRHCYRVRWRDAFDLGHHGC